MPHHDMAGSHLGGGGGVAGAGTPWIRARAYPYTLFFTLCVATSEDLTPQPKRRMTEIQHQGKQHYTFNILCKLNMYSSFVVLS